MNNLIEQAVSYKLREVMVNQIYNPKLFELLFARYDLCVQLYSPQISNDAVNYLYGYPASATWALRARNYQGQGG